MSGPQRNIRNDIFREQTIGNGSQTVDTAGTAEALESSARVVSQLHIKAESGLADNIYVGDSGVTASNGFPLGDGDMLELHYVDLNKVFVDADSNGSTAKYLYVE